MSDENKPENKTEDKSGISPDPNKVAVDKAEFDKLRSAQERLDKLQKVAEEYDCDDVEQAINFLEEALYQNKQPDNIPEKKEDPKKPDESKPPAKDSSQEDERLKFLEMQSAKGQLDAQYAVYLMENEKDSRIEKKEMMKMLRGDDSAAIGAIAQKKFDGNLFMAAHYLSNLVNVESTAKSNAEKAAEAQAAAESSTQVGTGGKTVEPKGESEEEKVAAMQEEASRKIARPDNYVYPE